MERCSQHLRFPAGDFEMPDISLLILHPYPQRSQRFLEVCKIGTGGIYPTVHLCWKRSNYKAHYSGGCEESEWSPTFKTWRSGSMGDPIIWLALPKEQLSFRYSRRIPSDQEFFKRNLLMNGRKREMTFPSSDVPKDLGHTTLFSQTFLLSYEDVWVIKIHYQFFKISDVLLWYVCGSSTSNGERMCDIREERWPTVWRSAGGRAYCCCRSPSRCQITGQVTFTFHLFTRQSCQALRVKQLVFKALVKTLRNYQGIAFKKDDCIYICVSYSIVNWT